MAVGIDINLDDEEVLDVTEGDTVEDETVEIGDAENVEIETEQVTEDETESETSEEGESETTETIEEPSKPNPVKQLRDALKEEKRARLALEAELRRAKEQTSTAQEIELPPEPTLEDEDVDFDPDKFKAKTQQWLYTKLQVEQQQQARQQQAVKQQEAFNAKLSAYNIEKETLGYDDYANSENEVLNALDVNKQGIIVNYLDNPAKLVYALGKNPSKLYELASIQDPLLFQKEILRLEQKVMGIMGNNKKPPAPEKVLGGGAKPAVGSQRALEKAYEKAQKTGDWNEYFALKGKK